MAFAGYAAVFDRVDRAGDVVRRGAFAGAAAVPLLLNHAGSAVGEITVVVEDAYGLRVEGVANGPVMVGAGLSVGYRARRARQGAWRELLDCELLEVSLVGVPMQPLARVDRVGRSGD
ncbi:HK97 family phage prohead protease [Sphingomonas lenta]|uniref:HK97 family phage prohead protease n=1 Tax=Sphingomonas lenta TaxID=1141887 RepID=A0A2A2SDT4_9SPHN|nr:HK97 family phage prohead protease [Sphingomonas lenta]